MKALSLFIICLLFFSCRKNEEQNNFTLASFTPAAGGKCQLVLLNDDFSNLVAAGVQVAFNGVQAEVIVQTDSSLLVRVPEDASNGKITVVSGDESYTSAEDFTVLKGSWKRLPDFPGEARFGGAGFVIGDKIYYGTGSNNGKYFEDFWAYDPAAEQWTQKTDFPGGACYGSTGITVGDKGFVAFGTANGYKNFLWSYKPETDTWTQLADCPYEGDYGLAGFELDGKAYFGGGVESAKFWEYDPGTDAWSQLATSPSGNQRFAGIGFSLNGKGYTGLGGYEGDKKLYSFDPTDGQWTATTEIPTNQHALFFCASFLLNDKVYMRVKYDECWRFDPFNNNWEQVAAPCGSPQSAENAFSVGGKGYMICGNGGSNLGAWPGLTVGATKEIWEFTPED